MNIPDKQEVQYYSIFALLAIPYAGYRADVLAFETVVIAYLFVISVFSVVEGGV